MPRLLAVGLGKPPRHDVKKLDGTESYAQRASHHRRVTAVNLHGICGFDLLTLLPNGRAARGLATLAKETNS
jgi:hypothetical protein